MYKALDQDDEFEKISNVTSAKETWEKLQTSCKGEDKVKRGCFQTLRGGFESLHIIISKVIIISYQLKRNGEKLYDMRIIEKKLYSLGPVFEYIVDSIEETKDFENYIM